ncbi:MAG: ribosome small subunit-dependent GTPase A [Clostridia bacterium]|nr:ribosome small subunit-dependent GTPase A [Clostridia bacterium]
MGELQGKILKGIGGFYYIDTPEGEIECRARGIFRKENITPLVGDNVKIKLNQDGKTGVISEILPRKNSLIRPPVANISQIAAVIAVENPKPNLQVLDKLICCAENLGIKVLICINKSDLGDCSLYENIYKNAGFDVVSFSAKQEDISPLLPYLKDETTAFAGNSGVGKSSIINLILGEEVFETGEVSEKAERGKHTTRHSELRKLENSGYIIDTPGFTSFELQDITASELSSTFREFEQYQGMCKFPDCTHRVEKGCAVLEALTLGKIAPSRHESYLALYETLKNIKQWETKK